ncbi:YceG family protein [Bacillus sp. 2205SS5-2]|uniref:YceG family protein n=1 Tax=Bacillus sp. 2205SS5-2 TaxID=3109031 RepID=UPI0030054434
MKKTQTIQSTPIEVTEDNWRENLQKKLPDRDFYSSISPLQVGQVACRFLGIPYDETEYSHLLYELKQENVVILSETLDKTIDSERFQAIQRIHLVQKKEKGLSINRFVAFLEGEQLLPKHPDASIHRHLREAYICMLVKFEQHHPQGLLAPEFRRVFLDSIKWLWNHLAVWLKHTSLQDRFPSVLWYGEMNKSQQYFLFLLMIIGCDVLIFHPEGKDEFAEIDGNNQFSKVIQYPSKGKMQPFPTEEPERTSTVAYRASREMDAVLHHSESQLYKPWQFRKHIPHVTTLKTTYDELFLLAKERAFIRPNFAVIGEEVKIPSLFSKIMGVSQNRKEYWNKMQLLIDQKLTATIKHFPFTTESTTNQRFHYEHATENGRLSPEKLMESHWWKYKHLPNGTQHAIAHGISRVCAERKLLPQLKESSEQISLYLFTQCMDIPEIVLKLIQQFDYAQEIPKLILYNNEVNGSLSRSDAALLLFMNEIGFDIILYNPPGHNCIEQFIQVDVFDTHWLEEMIFELEFKEESVLQKFIKSIKR